MLSGGSCARQTRRWVDDITSSWNFRQIIPCHFAAPVKAGPREFRWYPECNTQLLQSCNVHARGWGVCPHEGAEYSCSNLFAAMSRAAFDFAYEAAREAGSGAGGGSRRGLLARLLGGRTAAPVQLPAGDMRALDGLARILRTVGVLNK